MNELSMLWYLERNRVLIKFQQVLKQEELNKVFKQDLVPDQISQKHFPVGCAAIDGPVHTFPWSGIVNTGPHQSWNHVTANCDWWLHLLHLLKSAFQMPEIGKIIFKSIFRWHCFLQNLQCDCRPFQKKTKKVKFVDKWLWIINSLLVRGDIKNTILMNSSRATSTN